MPQLPLFNGKGRIWKVAATDFVFLWDECPRCFYRKIVEGISRPRGPFPAIFGVIDNRMKLSVDGVRTDTIPGMPPGVMRFSESFVESNPIMIARHADAVVIRGRFDVITTLDDGGYGITDLKTISAMDGRIERYSRQLWAYTHAVENAAPGKPSFKPVTQLGLVVYEPAMFVHRRGVASLTGDLAYIPMKRDDEAFMTLVDDVLRVLEKPAAPVADPGCEWCRMAA